MTENKKAPPLKGAGATTKMSKDELADLLKQAEEEDPDADENEPLPPPASPAAESAAPSTKGKAAPTAGKK
ncbi:MAG: hypothetical protein A2138_18765 [Deltaproteobacteria bacterium RBG_16_71_12]|nr:MAG: hypothetical protein A2138_18765 [Deltaproteobacteria bacterium RBG_16_71_12]